MTAAFLTDFRHPSTRIVRPLRIGLLTPHNPFDRRAFSGTAFCALRALSQQGALDLRVLGPHRPIGRTDRLLRRRSPRFDPQMLDPEGKDFIGLDAVLGLVASPLLDAARTLTRIPLVHVTDATPRFLHDIYGRDVPEAVFACEARVLSSTTPVYSSQVMAKRAAREFGSVAEGAHALAFGVNLEEMPDSPPTKAPLDRLELLFVGGDWTRKGGAVALAAFDRIRAEGRDAHLTLVGGIPDDIRAKLKKRSDVTVEGFLDKNRAAHLARLKALFARAHLFVLPTRADCTPMVVAEALAGGTPVLASDVGGIAEMIGQGAGRSLPLAADAGEWAAAIREITALPEAYALMSDAARDRAAMHLNWEVWARGIARIVFDVVLDRVEAA